MCYVWCKELKGWCKSFTWTEGLLSILEAILLVVFIGFLVFLTLHFVACSKLPDSKSDNVHTTESDKDADYMSHSPWINPPGPPHNEGHTRTSSSMSVSTVGPAASCTWDVSKPTSPATRYYVTDRDHIISTTPTTFPHLYSTTTQKPELVTTTLQPSHDYDDVEFLEPLDGTRAEDMYNKQVIALVKLKTPGDATFGCILTKISRYWTLTAASCVESIEEMDSLDSFVMVEGWGVSRTGRGTGVAEVRVHPQYSGRSPRHDLAALRAARELDPADPLRLPTMLDYFLLAIGERFFILGYGGYRTVQREVRERALWQVDVYAVSSEQCGAGGGAGAGAGEWAPRHLEGGAAQQHAACGTAPLCAGPRYARGEPCNYCAGAPLTRAGLLFGIMSDNAACAVSCEPQLYVNIATHRNWIDSVIE